MISNGIPRRALRIGSGRRLRDARRGEHRHGEGAAMAPSRPTLLVTWIRSLARCSELRNLARMRLFARSIKPAIASARSALSVWTLVHYGQPALSASGAQYA